MPRALMIAAAGSAAPEARAAISALEKTLSGAAPGYLCVRAFTSPAVRRVLAGRGEYVPGPAAALERLRLEGVRRVVVQPAHLLPGHEYGRLREEVLSMAGGFESLELGFPLLADGGDVRAFAARLARNSPAAEGAAVFMGHGTGHAAGMVFPALQEALRLEGRDDIYIGVMQGAPGLDDILRQLGGPRRVLLRPLLLAAGTHARREMAGEWRTRLEQAGHIVRCLFAGLGELPWVQEMYREKLLRVLPPP